MEALSRLHDLDLDDTALATAHCIDGVYPELAIAYEPRHHVLRHTLTPYCPWDRHEHAPLAALPSFCGVIPRARIGSKMEFATIR